MRPKTLLDVYLLLAIGLSPITGISVWFVCKGQFVEATAVWFLLAFEMVQMFLLVFLPMLAVGLLALAMTLPYMRRRARRSFPIP